MADQLLQSLSSLDHVVVRLHEEQDLGIASGILVSLAFSHFPSGRHGAACEDGGDQETEYQGQLCHVGSEKQAFGTVYGAWKARLLSSGTMD